jgi:hypothetical protein
MLKQIKKTLGILLVVCFLISVTTVAASAHGGSCGRWDGYPWPSSDYSHFGCPYTDPYVATAPFSVLAFQEALAPIVTYWPAQASAVAVSAGPTIIKEKKKVTSRAVSKRPTMVKEKKKATSKAVSTKPTMVKETKKATARAVSVHDGNCDYGCEYDCEYNCDSRSFIDIFIHWLPCLENCTLENFTSENCTL